MLRTGRFTNQSEVVREALRRMERQENSYLNPPPLTRAEAERIYASDLLQERFEQGNGFAVFAAPRLNQRQVQARVIDARRDLHGALKHLRCRFQAARSHIDHPEIVQGAKVVRINFQGAFKAAHRFVNLAVLISAPCGLIDFARLVGREDMELGEVNYAGGLGRRAVQRQQKDRNVIYAILPEARRRRAIRAAVADYRELVTGVGFHAEDA